MPKILWDSNREIRGNQSTSQRSTQRAVRGQGAATKVEIALSDDKLLPADKLAKDPSLRLR